MAKAAMVTRVPVQWGDQDAFNHVNNAMYVRYFETCRVQYMAHLVKYMTIESVGPILGEVHMKYRYPVTFPATLKCFNYVPTDEITTNKLNMYTIMKLGDKVACEGKAVVVSFDYKKRKKASHPKELIDFIHAMEPLTDPDIKERVARWKN